MRELQTLPEANDEDGVFAGSVPPAQRLQADRLRLPRSGSPLAVIDGDLVQALSARLGRGTSAERRETVAVQELGRHLLQECPQLAGIALSRELVEAIAQRALALARECGVRPASIEEETGAVSSSSSFR